MWETVGWTVNFLIPPPSISHTNTHTHTHAHAHTHTYTNCCSRLFVPSLSPSLFLYSNPCLLPPPRSLPSSFQPLSSQSLPLTPAPCIKANSRTSREGHPHTGRSRRGFARAPGLCLGPRGLWAMWQGRGLGVGGVPLDLREGGVVDTYTAVCVYMWIFIFSLCWIQRSIFTRYFRSWRDIWICVCVKAK